MKQLSIFLIAAVGLFLASCNNQPKPAEVKPVTDTIAKPVVTTPAFMPYKAMLVQHTVKDFAKWEMVFKALDTLPKSFGLTTLGVGQALDNDKSVLVFSSFQDVQKAKDFAASKGLKDAMKKAGVTSPPAISYVDVVRDDTTWIAQKERMMITHHVKDFDAWLKVFDAEGKAKRAEYGLVDRGMSRNIDDPNTVTILFAITDMDKAKARGASPELKKIMTDAGVDGPPQITYFKWVE